MCVCVCVCVCECECVCTRVRVCVCVIVQLQAMSIRVNKTNKEAISSLTHPCSTLSIQGDPSRNTTAHLVVSVVEVDHEVQQL